jgi:hypothetical protein
MLFREIIAVYTENHTKLMSTKCRVVDCLKKVVHTVTIGIKGLTYFCVALIAQKSTINNLCTGDMNRSENSRRKLLHLESKVIVI